MFLQTLLLTNKIYGGSFSTSFNIVCERSCTLKNCEKFNEFEDGGGAEWDRYMKATAVCFDCGWPYCLQAMLRKPKITVEQRRL